MKKKYILAVFAIIISVAAIGQKERDFTPEQKFLRTLRIINNNYVDSVDVDKLVEHAVKSMLEHLDPHSVYMTAEEIKRANEPLLGNFEGVGIQFQIIRDTINVMGVIPGGPSEQIGIQAGDKIVTIDNENVFGSIVSNSLVMSKLRGDKGTKVKVGIIRFPAETIIEYEIIRDRIPINSLDASYMIEDNIGYIKLNRFSNTTMNEFIPAIQDLKKQKMKSLILDLRGNSGGFLRTAIELTDQFFDRDKLLVYTEGLFAPTEKTFSTSTGEYKGGRLVVLVDQGSASASEILAGAIQDWDRGIIIGRRTFGKGLVQKPFTLSDGSVIRLTTARYYTPSGRCIQKPYDDDKKAYQRELRERLDRGEYVNQDSIKFPDSLMYKTSKGRNVYGGGGIMPDIFVSMDTTRLDDFYVEIMRKNAINIFVSDYLRDSRRELTMRYATVDAFKNDIKKNADILLKKFTDYLKNLEIVIPEIDDETQNYMLYIINANIARSIFDNQAFYQVIREIDNEINKAIEVIKDNKEFTQRGIKD